MAAVATATEVCTSVEKTGLLAGFSCPMQLCGGGVVEKRGLEHAVPRRILNHITQ